MDIPDDVAPLAECIEAWELSNDDMQSMFIDYYRNKDDEYFDQMKMAVHAVQYKMACKGFPNPLDDGTRQMQTVPDDSVSSDVLMRTSLKYFEMYEKGKLGLM